MITLFYASMAILLLTFSLYITVARIRRKLIIAENLVREYHRNGNKLSEEEHIKLVKQVASTINLRE